ncbi:MAG TPA: twin-arginine translocase subunit TatC [Gemmataceae bacterium]|nr:twin-arginine translocase subunit TatC [Gemmataceae bacterium]
MFAKFLNKNRHHPDYDEDFFKDTRMSFGDHLDELRTRMWRAIKGLGLFLIIGFILDGIGERLNQPWIGIGRPMLKIIIDPVEEQVKQWYHDRAQRIKKDVDSSDKDDQKNKTVEVRTKLPVQPLLDSFDGLKLKNPEQTHIEFVEQVPAADLSGGAEEGRFVTNSEHYLKGMGVMEAFMVYFKMSLLCGVVLACPWIFYQMWAFIGAGLYPHEKKLIHVYLPFSIGLFMGGCILCQFVVMPRAVDAMLGFYKWIDVDPDLRLNEWLSFALLMPLVFGISFQTPLVMMFLNKIGVVTYQTHVKTWRYALFGLAVLTALICPSTDVFSWLSLFIPTFGLYLVGVLICYLQPHASLLGGPAEEEEVEVGV